MRTSTARAAATTGERHEQVAATLRPRKRRPEFALDRTASERRTHAPFPDGHHHVGIDQRPGEVQRPAGLVGGEVGGARFDAGIKGLGPGDQGRVSRRLVAEGRALQHRHVGIADAGAGEAVAHRGHDGSRLGHVAGQRDHHPIAGERMGRQRRPVQRPFDGGDHEPAGLVAADAGGGLEHRRTALRGLEYERFLGAVGERDGVQGAGVRQRLGASGIDGPDQCIARRRAENALARDAGFGARCPHDITPLSMAAGRGHRRRHHRLRRRPAGGAP
jgi:hypothetical protein